MSDEESEYVEPVSIDNSESEDTDSSDEEDIVMTEFKDIEDINIFRKNYKSLMENNITSKYLNKYEYFKLEDLNL